ncbi:hypothetical protein KIPB_008662, partial [Kipferlia bialata]|eukprot:g8662.t1
MSGNAPMVDHPQKKRPADFSGSVSAKESLKRERAVKRSQMASKNHVFLSTATTAEHIIAASRGVAEELGFASMGAEVLKIDDR